MYTTKRSRKNLIKKIACKITEIGLSIIAYSLVLFVLASITVFVFNYTI